MSILEQYKFANIETSEESPKCPSAPRLKPFSSCSTFQDEEQKISIDLIDGDDNSSSFDLIFNVKQKKIKCSKKSMMQFLNQKIEKRKNKRNF